jgi:integrase
MAKKRGNNEGSIYKRKNGRWRAQISLHGRRIGISVKSKNEAQSWLRKIQDEVEGGLQYENTQVTLQSFIHAWLVSIEPSLRYNTNLQYRQIAETHILPTLGQQKLREIKPERIQQMYNRMVDAGKGLRTIRLTHAVLRRALFHANKLGLIARNPALGVVPPKYVRKEMKALDDKQAQQLLAFAEAKGDRFYALYHLAISTGMRQGELLGLKWVDVNLDQGYLQVQRQLVRMQDTQFGFSSPKTKSGIRRIDLGDSSVQVLKAHKNRQYEARVLAGSKWIEDDLVFPSSIGTPMNRDNLRSLFKRLLGAAGLPDIRFHDLRHTAASLMLNNGVPLLVVSKRLGHAQPSITLDVYGHQIPTGQQEAANLMDRLLSQSQNG